MTLELKDICGYLPYGLRIMRSPTNVPVVAELLDIRKDFTILGAGHIDTYRAVLRPMSDLTKGIIHRGKKFVPVAALNDIGRFIEFDATGLLYTVAGCIDSDWPVVFDKFHEWMFDYRGLISTGLAIDVNTLPENPYER